MNIKIILTIILIAIVGIGGGYFLVRYIWPTAGAPGTSGTPVVPQNGFLKGKINIGPLCPVERNSLPAGRQAPDPKCQPTLETYAAWSMAVYSSDGKNKIVEIKPDAGGFYKVELPIGNYIVDLKVQRAFAQGFPKAVTIKKGQITTLDIDIDTGIK